MTSLQIDEVNVGHSTVDITLDNGVSFSVTSNDGYIHLNFCGTEGPLEVRFGNPSDEPIVIGPNYTNIYYRKRT